MARTIATTEGETEAVAVAAMAETVAEVAAMAAVAAAVMKTVPLGMSAADKVTMGRGKTVATVARGRVRVAILVLQKRRK